MAVHIFGDGVAADVLACEGLTDDAGIAKQIGVDAYHFEFGHPAKKRCEIDGAVDGQSLIASEKREGCIAAIGGFHGFWRGVLCVSTQVETAIHQEVLWGCWAAEDAGLCVIDHPEISVQGMIETLFGVGTVEVEDGFGCGVVATAVVGQ